MIDPQNFGFAKLVPGFDFLQNLAKATPSAMPQMPDLSHWVAPTLDLDELDKRLQEFKAVQFWLEQNVKALAATIQALEVQKMTLATLKGMNYQMADLAEAMKIKPQATAASPFTASAARTASEPPAEPAARPARRPKAKARTGGAQNGAASSDGVVDPMQWWGSLTQQFQQIASQALQDVAQQGAAAASSMAGKPAKKSGVKSSARPAKTSPKKPAGAPAARKPAAARSPAGPRR